MQTALSRHIMDETRHAWLWTKRIMDMKGVVVNPDDGYQRRIGRDIIPRSLFEIFALTVVVEQRALTRYQLHLSRPDVDEETRKTLAAVSSDEHWHVGWIEAAAKEMAKEQGNPGLYEDAIARYRAIDDKVTIGLHDYERGLFGFSYADPFKPEDLVTKAKLREKRLSELDWKAHKEAPGVKAAAAAALMGI